MKCYEVTECSDEQRKTCYVWQNFSSNPQDMENIKCWVLRGEYSEEDQKQLQICKECKYYIMMNKDTGIVSDLDAQVAILSCQGTINNDRTRALEKVWANMKQGKKNKILLDLSDVNNIYSCGLGILVKIHKETREMGGMLVVVGVKGYVTNIFSSTKLSKIITVAPDRNAAAKLFDDFRKKEEAAKQIAIEAAKPKAPPPPPKKRVPCWEYFKNHNPANATTCDECFRKVSNSTEPCWIVEGEIEGVSFQYVNADCESCGYFVEFGAGSLGSGFSPIEIVEQL